VAPIDLTKLRSHIDFVRANLRKLEMVHERGREEFLSDDIAQAAATRWLQTSIEALVDISNHIIAREGLGVPRAYADTVEILTREGVLPPDRRDALLSMVRFRNRIVHLYDEVSSDEVWRIVDRDLGDFEAFISAIAARYFADRA
jgi:uncharacterized protein YutE (UPF0331/DUF86 family)